MNRKLFYAGLAFAVMTAGFAQAEPLPLSDTQLDDVAAGMRFERLVRFDVNIQSSADLQNETAIADAEADLVGPGMIFVDTDTNTEAGFFSFAESNSLAQNNTVMVQSRARGTGIGDNSAAGSNTRASLGQTSRAVSSSFAASSGFNNRPF